MAFKGELTELKGICMQHFCRYRSFLYLVSAVVILWQLSSDLVTYLVYIYMWTKTQNSKV